ncbi:TetR/AcrR family transcriptional regulator [Rhodococcus triatomae]|uniref:DNA-binding transcriptional regulator, AcrR family n=1 Tax=Rhodococcus triatomae TaxID=300028 RepID=A0A1G8KZ20_9NOCA|nr:TetR/AcrR family transcriptional regulator [Rhodococcus triatomae]QNG20465.1 TetR/AcrR family transcriptional regulator [Rhodococcus triatomae]QNG23617.1 TetR/AcrR family transcriptional regulator [Rhodococcus triatomae]SDI48652.1 DNA-binding transcriptional regulator, AcrR family [Rhodococcus triatomae]
MYRIHLCSVEAVEQTVRVTKRRGETRSRLLDAAVDVFAENGFGRSTVEQICERAGYTRGAFYSNFDSLDEMFFAMWELRSRAMLDGLRAAAERAMPDIAALAPAMRLHVVVEKALEFVPVDDAWYRINAEFTAHALRTPAVRDSIARREEAIIATIAPIVEKSLSAIDRRVVGDPATLGRALVAVHDGTSVQCLVDTDPASARALRTELFTRVLESYTEPAHSETERPQ